MKALAIAGLAGAIALALPFAAQAQDESESDWEFSGELTITSDYVWRGVSQTDENPAVQPGFEAAHSSGFYAGAWASNVDFDTPGDGIDVEVDIYAGWSFDLSDAVNMDLSVTRYLYPGANSGFNIDYNEYAASFTFVETYYATISYADDMVNSNVESVYLQFGGDWELGESGWGLSAAIGRFDFDSGIGDYTDFLLGVNRSFGPANVALTYTGTSGFDAGVQDFLGPDYWAGDRLQLSVGFEF